MSEYTIKTRLTADTKQFQKDIVEAEKTANRFKKGLGEFNSTGNSFKDALSSMDRKIVSFSKGVINAGENTQKAFKGISDAGRELSGIGMGLTAGITLPIAGLGVAIGKTAVDFISLKQNANIALNTMLGSADKAKAYTDELLAFAKTTPFAFPDILEGGKNLVAFGMDTSKTIPLLRALGDAVAATGGKASDLTGLTDIMGKIQAQGKIMAVDVWSLARQGIPALQMFANQMGISVEEVQQKITDGAVTSEIAFDMLVTGIENGTTGIAGSTAKMGGIMQDMKSTWSGAVDTFGSAWRNMSAEVVEQHMPKLTAGLGSATALIKTLPQILSPVAQEAGNMFTELVGQVGNLMEWINKLTPEQQQMIAKFIMTAAVAGPVVVVVGKLMSVIGNLGQTLGKTVSFAGKFISKSYEMVSASVKWLAAKKAQNTAEKQYQAIQAKSTSTLKTHTLTQTLSETAGKKFTLATKTGTTATLSDTLAKKTSAGAHTTLAVAQGKAAAAATVLGTAMKVALPIIGLIGAAIATVVSVVGGMKDEFEAAGTISLGDELGRALGEAGSQIRSEKEEALSNFREMEAAVDTMIVSMTHNFSSFNSGDFINKINELAEESKTIIKNATSDNQNTITNYLMKNGTITKETGDKIVTYVAEQENAKLQKIQAAQNQMNEIYNSSNGDLLSLSADQKNELIRLQNEISDTTIDVISNGKAKEYALTETFGNSMKNLTGEQAKSIGGARVEEMKKSFDEEALNTGKSLDLLDVLYRNGQLSSIEYANARGNAIDTLKTKQLELAQAEAEAATLTEAATRRELTRAEVRLQEAKATGESTASLEAYINKLKEGLTEAEADANISKAKVDLLSEEKAATDETAESLKNLTSSYRENILALMEEKPDMKDTFRSLLDALDETEGMSGEKTKAIMKRIDEEIQSSGIENSMTVKALEMSLGLDEGTLDTPEKVRSRMEEVKGVITSTDLANPMKNQGVKSAEGYLSGFDSRQALMKQKMSDMSQFLGSLPNYENAFGVGTDTVNGLIAAVESGEMSVEEAYTQMIGEVGTHVIDQFNESEIGKGLNEKLAQDIVANSDLTMGEARRLVENLNQISYEAAQENTAGLTLLGKMANDIGVNTGGLNEIVSTTLQGVNTQTLNEVSKNEAGLFLINKLTEDLMNNAGIPEEEARTLANRIVTDTGLVLEGGDYSGLSLGLARDILANKVTVTTEASNTANDAVNSIVTGVTAGAPAVNASIESLFKAKPIPMVPYKNQGAQIPGNIGSGAQGAVGAFTGALGALNSQGVSALSSQESAYKAIGLKFSGNLVTSFKQGETPFKQAATGMGAGANQALASKASETYTLGGNWGDGVIRGMESRRGGIISTATSLASAANAAYISANKIGSPSKVMRKLAGWWGEGGILGIKDKIPEMAKTAAKFAEIANQSFTTGIGSMTLDVAQINDIQGRLNGSYIADMDITKSVDVNVTVSIGDVVMEKEKVGRMVADVVYDEFAERQAILERS